MTRRRFFLAILVGLILGLYIGHLATDGAKASSAPTVRFSLSSSNGAFHHFSNRWEALPPALGDALAESGYPNADTRVWENCAVRPPLSDTGITRVICPNGYYIKFRMEWHRL